MNTFPRVLIGVVLVIFGVAWFIRSLPEFDFFVPTLLIIVGGVSIVGNSRLRRIQDHVAKERSETGRAQRNSRISLILFGLAIVLFAMAFLFRHSFSLWVAAALGTATIGMLLRLYGRIRNIADWTRSASKHWNDRE